MDGQNVGQNADVDEIRPLRLKFVTPSLVRMGAMGGFSGPQQTCHAASRKLLGVLDMPRQLATQELASA